MNHLNIDRGAVTRLLLLAITTFVAPAPGRALAQEVDPFAEQKAREFAEQKAREKESANEQATTADATEGKSANNPPTDQSDDILKDAIERIHKANPEVQEQEDRVRAIRAMLNNSTLSDAQVSKVKEQLAYEEAKLSAIKSLSRPPLPEGEAGVRRLINMMQAEIHSLQHQVEGEKRKMGGILTDYERLATQRDLPPLKNAEVQVFQLANAAPEELARVIDSIFSPAQLRLSIDERTKSLVVMGDKESLGIVEALLAKMDQPAEGAADAPLQEGAKPQAAGDRSLLLRVFWLADGLPADEGQDPAAYLPKSVLKALDGLGLKAPRLVTQTVNSLAVGSADKMNFATSVPAVVGSQPATLNLSGSMQPIVDERAALGVNIRVSGNIQCELMGSLATPLGHYMVLGTTNSLALDPAAAGMGAPGGFGMEGGFMPEMADVEPSVQALDDPTVAGAQKAPRPKFNEARFAFVVQVVEATSYPAEKDE